MLYLGKKFFLDPVWMLVVIRPSAAGHTERVCPPVRESSIVCRSLFKSYQMMLSVVNERPVARTSSRGLTRKPGCTLRLAPVLPAQASAVADTLRDARARGRLVPTASVI